MRREHVTVGRKQISYLISEPSAPTSRQHPLRTVVFLHAFPLQAAMWEPNLGAMPDGWRAVAPDFRGFGESPLPDSEKHRMSEFAGDVIDLLDRLEVTEAAVIGCSMGGYVLFELLKSAPRYISAVGLVSTRPGADSEEGRKNRAEDDRPGRSRRCRRDCRADGAQAAGCDDATRAAGFDEARARPDYGEHGLRDQDRY